MSEPFEQPAAISAYGAQRRQDWLARLQANADAMSQAAIAAHQQDHDVITRSTHGIMGALSPQEQAAAVAARQATVGTAWGHGRPLERHGGTFNHNLGPAPARRDLRYAGQVQPPGESPLAAYMRERQ